MDHLEGPPMYETKIARGVDQHLWFVAAPLQERA